MIDLNYYAEDLTERYIYQVSKHLDATVRKDIEDELRALISDMVDQRTQGEIHSKEDIHAVLHELGNPTELANKYRDKTRYLIGPEFFPLYTLILKIVLITVLIAMTVVTTFELLAGPGLVWYEYLAEWISSLVMSVGMAFAWVTAIFAVNEWRGLDLKKLVQEFHNFDISELPPVPKNEMRIPLWEPICGLIFSVIVAIIFILAPQLMGAYYFDEGLKTIPIFNLEVFRTIIPAFLVALLLGVATNVWEIIEGRYTRKYALFVFITNIINIMVTVFIFSQKKLWNTDFIPQLNSVSNLNINLPEGISFHHFINGFVVLLVVAFVIDTASVLYKAFKYSK